MSGCPGFLTLTMEMGLWGVECEGPGLLGLPKALVLSVPETTVSDGETLPFMANFY
jgi:hypothetical protein